MRTRAIHAIGATLMLLAGCAGTQDPAAMNLTAVAHENAAVQEERAAREQMARYDPNRRVRLGTNSPVSQAAYTPEVYNPTERYRERAVEHRQQANAHRQAAADLREYEARECRAIPTETRETCPVLLGVERIEDVDGGVRITFADGVDPSSTVQHVKCHLAFSATEGPRGTESCALYVHGAQAEAAGQQLILTTTDRDEVVELRRRARMQVP